MVIKTIVAFLVLFLLTGCEEKNQEVAKEPIEVEYLSQEDINGFTQKMQTRLPKYIGYFKEASKSTDIPWKLLAALSYKESHWDNSAVSPTGVRGIMMLTLNTAQSLGANRLDPKSSIEAAARYLDEIDSKLPDIKNQNLKQNLILISYNAGPSIIRRVLNSTKKKYNSYKAEVVYDILKQNGLNHSIEYAHQVMEYFKLLEKSRL